jgi:hypothetical protein
MIRKKKKKKKNQIQRENSLYYTERKALKFTSV